jgi:hypothetical protein
MAIYKAAYFSMLISISMSAVTGSAQKTTESYRVILLPEFYHYQPVIINDTTYKYECFGEGSRLLNIDELNDISDVDNISYTKSFYQYPKRANSPISPPYASLQLYAYFKNDDGTWRGRDMVTQVKTGFREDKNKIVRSDTAMTANRLTGASQLVIHRYYEVKTVDIKTVKAHHENH